jgi:nicotinamidase-related amidase
MTMKRFPDTYEPARIGALFYPDMAAIARCAASANLTPAVNDTQRIHLVLIDMQIDFCHDSGNLPVPGALQDIRRTIEFIYRHAGRISQITCSLDAHLPRQIFFPNWWTDDQGNHPAPFTIITAADVAEGSWRPVVDVDRSIDYVRQLEDRHKKKLCIWPYHTLIGSIGQMLDPELWSAVFWHAVARRTQPHWLSKGSVPHTEHYSIIQPEVPAPDETGGGQNREFLNILAEADQIIIAGEAESHCVLETVEDLVENFGGQPQLLNKIYFLKDCTSPVAHPEIDFHAIAINRFNEFEKQGVKFIDSTEKLPF